MMFAFVQADVCEAQTALLLSACIKPHESTPCSFEEPWGKPWYPGLGTSTTTPLAHTRTQKPPHTSTFLKQVLLETQESTIRVHPCARGGGRRDKTSLCTAYFLWLRNSSSCIYAEMSDLKVYSDKWHRQSVPLRDISTRSRYCLDLLSPWLIFWASPFFCRTHSSSWTTF